MFRSWRALRPLRASYADHAFLHRRRATVTFSLAVADRLRSTGRLLERPLRDHDRLARVQANAYLLGRRQSRRVSQSKATRGAWAIRALIATMALLIMLGF